MENQEKQPKGYRLMPKAVSKEEITEGNYYFNERIGEVLVKIITKHEKHAKCEIWNHNCSKFKQFTASYDGFYTKVQVPVYDEEQRI